MSQCRDWLRTLWPASYKGVAFFFETDDEEGGRGLVIHKFPNRDEPYLEDLGEEPRFYEGSAYVTGEAADRLAVAFTEVLASRGPGSLVVPIRGPVLVRCQTFQRRHDKDRMGYVAFRVKFVREGASTGLISVPHLAALIDTSVARLVSSLADAFAPSLVLDDQPEFVVAAATEAVERAVETLDAYRSSERIDPVQSSALRNELDAVYPLVHRLLLPSSADDGDLAIDAAYAAISRYVDPPASTVSGRYALALAISHLTIALAETIPAETAVRVMREIAIAYSGSATAPPYKSALLESANRNAVERHFRLSALAAFAASVKRREYLSRPDGVTARAEVSARFEAELEASAGAENAALYVAIQELRGSVVEYLTKLIADLAPVVTVIAPQTMPSLWWSWRLYAVASRAPELVARNRLPHPSFVPREFQALAR